MARSLKSGTLTRVRQAHLILITGLPGTGKSTLLAAIPPVVESVHVTQVLCRASEPVRIARLTARAADPSRHAGHRDADLAVDQSPPPVDFLALSGDRFVFDSDAVSTQMQSLCEVMEQQRRVRLYV